MKVVISGFLVGFRIINDDKKMGFIDLLQFGDSQTPAKIKECVIYDLLIIDYLVKKHNIDNGIPLVVVQVDIVEMYRGRTKEEYWVIKRLMKYKGDAVNLIYDQEGEQDGNRAD